MTPLNKKEEEKKSERYITSREKRGRALVVEMMENGFTEQQARWLINLLDNFIPIV